MKTSDDVQQEVSSAMKKYQEEQRYKESASKLEMEKKTREIEDLKDQLSGLRDALTSSHSKK